MERPATDPARIDSVTARQASIALTIGGLVGAVLTVAPWIVLVTALGKGLYAIPMLLALPYSLIAWGFGMLLVGAPGWWLLRRFRLANPVTMIFLGAVLTFIVVLGIGTGGFDLLPAIKGSTLSARDAGGPTVIDNRMTPHGWMSALVSAMLMAAIGGIVGWVVDWVGRRRPTEHS